MGWIESIKETLRSPFGAVSGALGSVLAVGHLTGTELVSVAMSSSGSWFGALAVSSTTIIPNLDAVLSGSAPTHIMVLVVGGSVYVAILGDRVLQKLVKELKDR